MPASFFNYIHWIIQLPCSGNKVCPIEKIALKKRSVLSLLHLLDDCSVQCLPRILYGNDLTISPTVEAALIGKVGKFEEKSLLQDRAL